jgi:hypothetical protein
MDFKQVTEKLLSAFQKEGIHYALMGGFALGAWGVPRTTVDIDFLIHRDDVAKVHIIMTGLGYACCYQTENVSQFISPLKIFGEIDFLHAFREISLGMLRRAEDKKIFDDTITIRVLRVEDLIGLKVQAMANDSSRTARDHEDIKSLIALYENNLDWNSIDEYFRMFGMLDMLYDLKQGLKQS